MKSVRAVFLWHLHQPEYRDPQTGQPLLPWVRLHACRAYLDMAVALERRPEVRVVANWAPSLLLQLSAYLDGTAVDRDEALARKTASDLEPGERAHVLRESFSVDWDLWVKPVPRYAELLARRGTDLRSVDLGSAQAQFTAQELCDLQVHFILAWMGFAARAEEPLVQELLAKERNFTEGEKAALLEVQRRLAAQVLPRWRTLAARGQVEMTCSPLYHPILPLLIDSDCAQRALPDIQLPPRFRHPEDARAQIVRGLDRTAEAFGARPVGMWPSEGSVSPEVMDLLAACGVQWCATDQGNLERSDLSPQSEKLPEGFALHHRPYLAGSEGKVSVLFRDRDLSDAIGFRYARSGAQQGAQDLVRRIGSAPDGALVTLALDGENPWEHYPKSGELFLGALYRLLEEDDRVVSVLPREELREQPGRPSLPKSPGPGRISRIHSGSWIDACYRIWIGHPEDNQAWSLLGLARDRLAQAEAEPPPPAGARLPEAVLAQAREAIYAAEGSDWFWWYGDDFTTENAPEFDALFRRQLGQVYRVLGLSPPERLSRPIIAPHKDRSQGTAVVVPPRRLIAPIIDGFTHGYYEWAGAGLYKPGQTLGGSMFQGQGVIAELWYGFSMRELFLRLDPVKGQSVVGAEMRILITRDRPVPAGGAQPGREERTVRMRLLPDGAESPAHDEHGVLCGAGRCGAIVELSLAQAALGVEPGDRVGLSVQVLRDEGGLPVEVDRLPRYGDLELLVPDRAFERAHWQV